MEHVPAEPRKGSRGYLVYCQRCMRLLYSDKHGQASSASKPCTSVYVTLR